MFLVFGIALPTAATFIIYGIGALNEGNLLFSVGSFFIAIFPLGVIVAEVAERLSKKSSG